MDEEQKRKVGQYARDMLIKYCNMSCKNSGDLILCIEWQLDEERNFMSSRRKSELEQMADLLENVPISITVNQMAKW